MKKTKYQKIILVAVIGIMIYPSMALASWWNPFSWFNNWTFQKIEEIQVVDNKESNNIPKTTQTQTKPVTKTVTETTTTKKDEVKVVAPIITTPPIVTAPVITTPPVQNTAPVELIKLNISNVTSNSTSSSIKVSWETNINSESKILLNGKAYFSENGVGKFHSTEINNLDASHSYTGTVTALANNVWDNEDFTFTTKQAPPIITIQSRSCVETSCTIKWQTDYQTNSKIIITQAGNTQVSWEFNSENGTSTNHIKTINVSLNTDYSFRIEATGSSETGIISGSFTSSSSTPCSYPGHRIPCPASA